MNLNDLIMSGTHFRTFEYKDWKGELQASVEAKNSDAALLEVARECVADEEEFNPHDYVLSSVIPEPAKFVHFADKFKEYLLSDEVQASFVNEPEEDEHWLIVQALLVFIEKREGKHG